MSMLRSSSIKENDPAVVVTDLKMPGRSGLDLVEEISRMTTRPEVVVITAFGSIETAVRAMRAGAYDYLTKPLERDELLLVIERAAEKYRLRIDSMSFRNQLANQSSHGLIAESAAMQSVLEIARKVASSDATVLIRGESGTGKEKIAQLIHYLSPRGSRPMQSINCAAFPETLLESELYRVMNGELSPGRRRGRSASSRPPARARSSSTRLRICRSTPRQSCCAPCRRGKSGAWAAPVRCRSICASLRPPIKISRRRSTRGTFRDDLFYRLNVIPIVIPPLRERTADIPAAR